MARREEEGVNPRMVLMNAEEIVPCCGRYKR